MKKEATTRSKFVKVKCKCENEQTLFSNASIVVKCSKCGEVLAEPSGGIANIKGKITKILE